MDHVSEEIRGATACDVSKVLKRRFISQVATRKFAKQCHKKSID